MLIRGGETQFNGRRLSKLVIVNHGTAAIRDAVVEQLQATRQVRRVSGANRFQTAMAMYEESITAGMDPSRLYLTTGRDWHSAMTIGPMVGAQGATMLIVDDQGLGEIRDLLWAHRRELREAIIVGKTATIGDQVRQEVMDMVTAD